MASLWARALAALPEKDQRMFHDPSKTPAKTSQILDDILLAVETQRDRCKRDRWKITSRSGKTLVIRDVCAKITSYVTKFMAVVDVVAQYDPVHMSLPWAGVRLLLQLCLTAFEAFGALVEGLETATGLIARGAIVEALIFQGGAGGSLSDAEKALERDILSSYTTVLGFLCRAKRYHDKSLAKRVAHLISREGIHDSVRQMTDAEQRVILQKGLVDSERIRIVNDKVLTMDLTARSTADDVNEIRNKLEAARAALDRPLIRTMEQISNIHQALDESDRRDLLSWTSSIMAEEHYRETIASSLPGLGRWLLEDPRFISWRDSSSSETFWLHGIPGCGKTKLAAAVIQHLRLHRSSVPDAAPIAHLFCTTDTAEPECRGAREILQSLIKQLSVSRDTDSIRAPLVVKYRERRQEANRIGERPSALSLEDSIELICELGLLGPMTIVIDGLDECVPHQRTLLLEAFDQVRQKCRDVVKIFVSSRYEQDIAAHLRDAEVVEATAKSNEKDMKRFVEAHVGKFIKRWSTIHDETDVMIAELEKEITITLLEGAQGMFLWVRLQLEALNDSERIKNVDDIRQALAHLPSTLRDSYTVIYGRIALMGARARAVALKTFQWLLYAKGRLPVPDFLLAVNPLSGSSPGISHKSILDYCCNLVVLDGETNSFRLAHATVREFLLSLDEYTAHEANAVLARRCLDAYLLSDCDHGAFLGYATQYWPVHVEQVRVSQQRETIKPALVEFFTEEDHFEDWLENLESRPVTEGPDWSNDLERRLNESVSSPPSPLFTICCFGLIEMLDPESTGDIDVLDIHQTNRHGTSGLYLAARAGHLDVVQKLLDFGADANAAGHQYGTALQAASFAGHPEIVKLLLRHGASACPTSKGEYSSPLQAAVANGHDQTAEALLDAGLQLATPEQFDDALEAASFKGNVHMVELLLSGKASEFTPQTTPDALQVALSSGKARQAKRLLETYGDINTKTGYFGNALAAAIASRKLALVKLVVDAGADVHARGRFGFPLRAATLVDRLDIVEYLLEKGMSPNVKDKELGDPLQAAASLGNLDMMLLLVRHNAAMNGYGGYFGNTLQAAAFNGHEQAVRLLLEHGARLNNDWSEPTGRYRDALQAAVYAGHENVVRALLDAGAQLNPGRVLRGYPQSVYSHKRRGPPGFRNGTGNLDIPMELGPLEMAARQGRVALVLMLLSKGSRVDSLDANKRDEEYDQGNAFTALQIAAFHGHLGVMECLLNHGADMDAVRQTLGTPLQAALEGKNKDAAELLLTRGADIDKHWAGFGSCLQVFAHRGDIETVKFLLGRGANIEDQGADNGNALQIASGEGHFDIVRLLLDKGADPNARGKNNGSSLQDASASGHANIVELLITCGAKVNDGDEGAASALSFAAANGHDGIVRLLLQNGSSLNPQGPCESPIHLAAWGEHAATVSILLEYGASIHVEAKPPRIDGGTRKELDFVTHLSTPLQAACFKGSYRTAKLLFIHDPWGYIRHETFLRALKTAIERDSQEVYTMFIRKGVRIGFHPDHFAPVFRFACEKGRHAFVEEVLNEFELENWQRGIFWATSSGRTSVVQALVNRGVDVNFLSASGRPVLNIAIDQVRRSRRVHYTDDKPDWISVVKVLVESSASGEDILSELHSITRDIVLSGNVDALRSLQYHGYCLLQDSTRYCEALMTASEIGCADMVQVICGQRSPTTSEVNAALLASLQHWKPKTEIIKLLLSYHEPLSFDDDGPLIVASRQGHPEIVSVLLETASHSKRVIERSLEAAILECTNSNRDPVTCVGILLDSRPDERVTHLAICARAFVAHPGNMSSEMVTCIVDRGMHPDARDSQSGTTLLYAATQTVWKTDVVETLISYGADPHLKGGELGTPLHAAAALGSKDVAVLLLSAGADINAQNHGLRTPLAEALQREWREDACHFRRYGWCCSAFGCHACCVRTLLDWGADIDALGEDETVMEKLEIARMPG